MKQQKIYQTNNQKINEKIGVENRRVPGPIFHRFWMDFEEILWLKGVQTPFQKGMNF